MNFIGKILLILLIVNGLLIYTQYSQAEGGDVIGKDVESYSQDIEVINRPDALHIRHHFRGLSNVRREIVWPEKSINRSCYLADASTCNRLDENSTAFLEGDNDRQSISYDIPKTGTVKKTALFNAPFASLYDSSVVYTYFHMTDETGIGGLWVNGLEQVGEKEMTNINYALFRGSGEVNDLYWQKNNLPLFYAGDRLTVFGKGGDTKRLVEVDKALKAVDANHSAVVIDNSNPPVHSDRFIVSDNTDVVEVSDRLLTMAMYERYSIQPKEQLTAEVIASILGGKPVGSKKSREMYHMLTETISKEELGELRALLSDLSSREINATVLDELAGEVIGFKTTFFTRNNQGDAVGHPFLIEDPRKVSFEGKDFSDIQVILREGKTLYPAKKVLKLAGYKVSSNERSIYINNKIRKFRFPLNDFFYVYNEHRYDVVTMPFEILENDFYFEESWFKRLFLLSIEKTADTIEIRRISTLLEEEKDN
ncbi:hypothetical protein [Sporosarcina sp. JAI121]|uniref:hypothetical protein n=1 Tax=Sporosarcina sp. JAI121 TaxID=2723064 RepID=UPI0015CC0B1A|nr:hypothetical protein [Sporosarcina sp. JAI121]NYF24119.1 hypothetical protein [Sporosarcina sp. JAI121]